MVLPVRIAALLTLACVPVIAQAQMGPSEPEVIAAATTARITLGSRKPAGRAVATVRVGEDGRVRDAKITENTAEAALEPQLLKVFQSAVFRPAIDASGRPVEASLSVKIELRASTGDFPKVVAANPAADHNDKEKARIRSMRCSDFLWEHDLLSEEASDKDALAVEFMPRIATLIYANERSAAGDRVDVKVWKAAAKGLREAAERCRENPQAAFWQDTFKPIMDEAVGR